MQPMRFRFDSMLPQRAGVWRRGVDRPIDHWGSRRAVTRENGTCTHVFGRQQCGCCKPSPRRRAMVHDRPIRAAGAKGRVVGRRLGSSATFESQRRRYGPSPRRLFWSLECAIPEEVVLVLGVGLFNAISIKTPPGRRGWFTATKRNRKYFLLQISIDYSMYTSHQKQFITPQPPL